MERISLDDFVAKYNIKKVELAGQHRDKINNAFLNPGHIKFDENFPEEVLNFYGLWYEKHRDLELAKLCYITVINKGEKLVKIARGNLVILCSEEESFECYKSITDKKIALDFLYALITKCYDSKQRVCSCTISESAIKLAEELGVLEYRNSIAFSLFECGKFDLVEKYCLATIKDKDSRAMEMVARVYRDQKKYDLAEKYYVMSIEHGNYLAYNGIACMYYYQNKFDLARKNFILGLEHGDINTLNNLRQSENNLRLFQILTNLEEQINQKEHKERIKLEIQKLKKAKEVHCYNNKINLLKMVGSCPVCMTDDTTILPKDCGHSFCKECYIDLVNKVCPICNY